MQLLQDCVMIAAQQTYNKAKSSAVQPRHKPFFDEECREALRKYLAAKQDPTSHAAKHFLKQFRTIVRRKKRRYTQHVAAKLADLAKHSPAHFWRRFRQQNKAVPIADLDKWMAHFEKLLNVPVRDASTDSHFFDVHLPDSPCVAALNGCICADEVSDAIKCLKRNKSSDLYGMRAEFIIDATSQLSTPIAAVFNTVFQTSFPASQSIGRLCPIFKSGDMHDMDNYRGITVSTVLSKLYATVLERRISSWAEANGRRATGQAGFRQDHRTTDNIFIMRTLIESCKATKSGRQHGRLYACFVDFRKAFDTIPREKLWQHLTDIGIQGKMLEAIKSYYSSVRVCVDIPSVGTSAAFDSTMGVKQGCPMSPVLFGLYIDQLEHHLMSCAQDAPELLNQKVPILLYADDIVLLSKSAAGLQHLLHILRLFSDEKLLSVNLAKTQVVIFNDFRHSHSDSFLFGQHHLQIVDHYTYLGIVLHRTGHFKEAIQKLACAGKRALFAMQYRCSELGIQDIKLRCSLFSSLVQPVLSYGCEIWGLENYHLWSCMSSVQSLFMKRTLHVRKSTPHEVLLCELGQAPLQLFWHKMLLQYVSRLVDLPNDRLVKKAFLHANFVKTRWSQQVSTWLCDNHFEGILYTGAFSVPNAVDALRDRWYSEVCQLSSVKVKHYVDNFFFDSKYMAAYLKLLPPSPALFALIKFRLGAHTLRVETDRWLVPKPPRESRICHFCSMQAVEDEQHFLFDCPFYSIIRGQHFALFSPNFHQRDIRLFFEANNDQLHLVARHIHLCFQARMSDESHLAPYPGL